MKLLGIFLGLVLAVASVPTAFSYQEDQKPDHGKFSFNGYSNGTQFSFGGYSNQTFPGFNQTNRGQEISYLVHEINYLRQELAKIIKEQKDDNKTKLHPLKPLEFANKTFIPHQDKPGKPQDARVPPHPGH